MATYIMLTNWTDQGIRGIKDSPSRLDTAKKVLKGLGGEFKAFYMTMGEYDMVAHLRRARRRRGGQVRAAARQARQRPDQDAQGLR